MKTLLVMVVALLCGVADVASAMQFSSDGGGNTVGATTVTKVATNVSKLAKVTNLIVTGTGCKTWTGSLPSWINRDPRHTLVVQSAAAIDGGGIGFVKSDFSTLGFVQDAIKILKTGKVHGAHVYGHSAGCGGALLAGILGGAETIDLYGTPDLGGIPDMARNAAKAAKYNLDARVRVHNNPKDPEVGAGAASPGGILNSLIHQSWNPTAAHDYSKDRTRGITFSQRWP